MAATIQIRKKYHKMEVFSRFFGYQTVKSTSCTRLGIWGSNHKARGAKGRGKRKIVEGVGSDLNHF